jgi:hypothetical protein
MQLFKPWLQRIAIKHAHNRISVEIVLSHMRWSSIQITPMSCKQMHFVT